MKAFLALKRPYFITSTGKISDDQSGYFVYFSSVGKYNHTAVLVDVLKEKDAVRQKYGEISIHEQDYKVDKSKVERVIEDIKKRIRKGASPEEAVIEETFENDLDDNELDILEKIFLRSVES